MLSKILTIALLAVLAVRLGLLRWKGLSQWFKRFVDVALLVLAAVYGFQLIVLLNR